MVRWLRWHCPPDTGFEIRALAVWGRARHLSVTEAPHNTDFHTWMGKKHLCFFQTAETGNRTPNSGVKGSGANHYPRAPAHMAAEMLQKPLSQYMEQSMPRQSLPKFHWNKIMKHWAVFILVYDWGLFEKCVKNTFLWWIRSCSD